MLSWTNDKENTRKPVADRYFSRQAPGAIYCRKTIE
jgi:hypothetical protein